MCVDTHSLNLIQFPLWNLIDSFVWIGIVHGILFDISGWYHCIWWILYTCKVIRGNTCAYLGLLGVACSPILSVSLEEVGCEPVLNLAATHDEAVSIICTVCWQNYTFNFFGKSWCMWAILVGGDVDIVAGITKLGEQVAGNTKLE
jgi:hypothetical protein